MKTDKLIRDFLIKPISIFFDIDESELLGSSRKAKLVEARHIFAYCLRKKLELSYPEIGKILERDHTSIMHACEHAEYLIGENSEIKNFINNLLNSFSFDSEKNGEEISGLIGVSLKNTNLSDNGNNSELKQYLIKKDELEEKEYFKNLSEIKKEEEIVINEIIKKYASINSIKEDYKRLINSLIEGRKAKVKKSEEILAEIKRADSSSSRLNYKDISLFLDPRDDLISLLSYDDINVFLPKFKLETKKYQFPIKFNKQYLEETFKELEKDRTKNILFDRYGFYSEETLTLETLSERNGITRERVRQIIWSGINSVYFNNFGGVRQIIYSIAEKILKEEIILLEDVLDDLFICENKIDKDNALKFLLLILSIINWIKKVDFSKVDFLINNGNRENVVKTIDDIKAILKKILSGMPDLVDDKWEYVLKNIRLFEYFKDKEFLLKNEVFLRACYDDLLFGSGISMYKNDNLKKYQIFSNDDEENLSGVPSEYKVFFN